MFSCLQSSREQSLLGFTPHFGKHPTYHKDSILAGEQQISPRCGQRAVWKRYPRYPTYIQMSHKYISQIWVNSSLKEARRNYASDNSAQYFFKGFHFTLADTHGPLMCKEMEAKIWLLTLVKRPTFTLADGPLMGKELEARLSTLAKRPTFINTPNWQSSSSKVAERKLASSSRYDSYHMSKQPRKKSDPVVGH